jgi:hypothetical protein
MKNIFLFVCILLAGAPGTLPCAAELAWHPEKGYRWAELAVPREGKAGFTLLPSEQTGITFTNPLDERAFAANHVLANGSGLAIGDIYHDDLPAIFLCSLDGHNALYKNLGYCLHEPDLPRGGVCGHQRRRLAGLAGEHHRFGRAVFHEQGGRDVCGMQ